MFCSEASRISRQNLMRDLVQAVKEYNTAFRRCWHGSQSSSQFHCDHIGVPNVLGSRRQRFPEPCEMSVLHIVSLSTYGLASSPLMLSLASLLATLLEFRTSHPQQPKHSRARKTDSRSRVYKAIHGMRSLRVILASAPECVTRL